MKIRIILSLCMLIMMSPAFTQDDCLTDIINLKQSGIHSDDKTEQEYHVSLKWQNLDALSGTSFNCNVVKATYIFNPTENKAAWKDAEMASISDFNARPTDKVSLSALDGFEYEPLNMDFLNENFYAGLPSELIDLARWLVSDAIQMQGLAWYVFDSLEFKKEFHPKMLEDYDIDFENWVSFSSRYQKLIWSAITKHNDELCAIIRFESLYNPVEADTPGMSFKGRSLYYGEIWVSLYDKQVEYAIMLEDVIMNLTGNAFPEGQVIDLQREIIFDKIR